MNRDDKIQALKAIAAGRIQITALHNFFPTPFKSIDLEFIRLSEITGNEVQINDQSLNSNQRLLPDETFRCTSDDKIYKYSEIQQIGKPEIPFPFARITGVKVVKNTSNGFAGIAKIILF